MTYLFDALFKQTRKADALEALRISIERSGFERAQRHMEFSKLLWEVRECRTALPEDHKQWMKLHDHIAEKVTGDLPKSIGYAFKEEKNWDLLTDRLFEKLLKTV